jgi:hypothetical protein
LAVAAEDVSSEIEVVEVIPARAEPDSSGVVLTSAVTGDSPEAGLAEKSQDEVAPGKAAAERTGEEGSAPAAETKDSTPEEGVEGAVADAEDAKAKPSSFPKGYLIVLVVCLGLAVFKHTTGKI